MEVRNYKIEAIKFVRSLWCLSLREAKDVIERYIDRTDMSGTLNYWEEMSEFIKWCKEQPEIMIQLSKLDEPDVVAVLPLTNVKHLIAKEYSDKIQDFMANVYAPMDTEVRVALERYTDHINSLDSYGAVDSYLRSHRGLSLQEWIKSI